MGRSADLHHKQTGKGFKGKIKPPRLNGQRRGALSTRTPHRPNPLGLSLCKIISVKDGCLILGGADLVDGTPVLDIKPYVPFCESVPSAQAPHWVSVRSNSNDNTQHGGASNAASIVGFALVLQLLVCVFVNALEPTLVHLTSGQVAM